MEQQDRSPDADRLSDLLATAASLRIDGLAAATKAELDARGIEAVFRRLGSLIR